MIGMLILRIQLFVLLSGHIGSQHLNEYLDEEQCRCGRMSTKISYRIFNGTPVDPNDLGFVANVFFNTQIINRKLPETNHLLLFNSLCTAVILNSKWFLSARSGIDLKLFRKLSESFFVGAGSTDLFKIYGDSNLYRVIHEIYESRTVPSESDIVLIEVRTPFELGPKFNIYAACLFDAKLRSFESAIVSGFGKRSATSKMDEKIETISSEDIPTPRRRWMITRHRPIEDMESNYSISTNNGPPFDVVQMKMIAPSRYLTAASMNQVNCDVNKPDGTEGNEMDFMKYFICLKDPQTSTCIGDAGAPMLISSDERLFVAAIATQPYPNASTIKCAPDQSTRFVLVQRHLDWIRKRTGGPFCESKDKPKKEKGLFGHVFVILLGSLLLLTVFAVFWREAYKRSQPGVIPLPHTISQTS